MIRIKLIICIALLWSLLVGIVIAIVDYNMKMSDIIEFFHWLITVKFGWTV